MDRPSGNNVKIFSSLKKAGRISIIGMVFFGILGSLSLIFFFNDGDYVMIFILFPIVVATISSLFFYIFFRHFTSYQVDDRGIRQIGGKGISLRWDEIGDISVNPSIGGMVEMKIQLVDYSGRQTMIIYADHLQRGGRTLLEELQRRLSSLFEKKTREYLSGQKHWNLPWIKDILRLEGDLLFIEFPKLKKQTIPLKDIRCVEWFPGAISGAKRGYLLIEYNFGKMEIPQNISGLAFFLFALKYIYGLGERVNPQMDEELTHKMDTIRQSQAKSFLFRVIAIGLMIGSAIVFGMAFMDLLDENAIRRTGIDSQGIVVKKLKNQSIRVSYKDQKGTDYEKKFYVQKDFYQRVNEEDIIDIRYHPVNPKEVMFEGRRAVGWRWHLKFMIISFFVFLCGGILLI